MLKAIANSGSGGGSGGGLTSLNGETGAVTLTSSGATIVITTPTGNTINLEAGGSAGVSSFTGDGVVLSNSSSTGAVTATLESIAKNIVLAGPSSGSNATPTFRALVGADLPNPSATTLGGIESYVAVSHQWINTISTSGVPSSSQPAFSDISGNITAAQSLALTDTHIYVGNGSNQPADVAMSGDATLADTGALTIGNNKITYAKMQQASTVTLLGNPTGSGANIQEITLGANLSFSGSTLVASGGSGSISQATFFVIG